jgi:hypothetical protein
MNKILFLLPVILIFSCEEDPIFGLERGWLRNDDIEVESDTTKIDTSQQIPTIIINSPNGGERWYLENNYDINWSRYAINGNVKIEIYKSGSYVNTIITSTENDGSFNWSIPNTLVYSNNYSIKISSILDNTINDFSDELFTIQANEGDDNLPNDSCNFIYETDGTNFEFIAPEQTLFNFGDSYMVTLSSDTYSVGQVTSVQLILNSDVVYNFGSWLNFSNNSRDFILPSESFNLPSSNCYTILILKGGFQYVSDKFTIY